MSTCSALGAVRHQSITNSKTGLWMGLALLVAAATALCPASALAVPPPGYYDTVDTDTPQLLRTTLHAVIDDHTQVPLHLVEHRHLEHPRAGRPGSGELRQHPRSLQEPQLRQVRRRHRPLQPRAHLAQQLRLSGRRRHQLPLHRLPPPLPVRCRLQQRPRQQAVRRLRLRGHRARHRLQRRAGGRLGGVPGQFQLVQRQPSGRPGTAARATWRGPCSTWTSATRAARTASPAPRSRT